MFAHVDCNNFYVSCERVFNSALEGKPVIVLSNNDGCAISRSNEAKALGIKMGANFFEIESFIKKKNVFVCSTNFVLYADMSIRVKSLLSRFCPDVEDYSIDEAFLDFRGFRYFDMDKHFRDMSHTVRQGTGIPVSIGVAPTKTLSKIATRFAKKYPAYETVCKINTEEKRIKALKLTPIADVWGIGRQHINRLNTEGVKTAYDFTQLNRSWVRKYMTVTGERSWLELQGESCITMEIAPLPKKNIMVSRSFGKPINDYDTVAEALSNYTSMATAKLRMQKVCAKSFMIFIQTNYLREDFPQYENSVVVSLPVATNSTMEIVPYATDGLKGIFKEGYYYKKAGIILMDFCPQNSVQGNLFDRIDREKHKRLMKVMDKTNTQYGRNTLKLAAQGDGQRWKIRQEYLSPCYTTRLSDLPKVK